MDSWFDSLCQIVPLPILIGVFIWTFSMCLFSIFLFLIFILLNQRSAKLAQLISVKDLSNEERHLKSVFSCDSLSLISSQTTRKDVQEAITSFYLGNSSNLKENEINNLFPSIQFRSTITNENKQINSLPHLSTRRSIIRDLTYLSNSLKEKKLHQSVDSLFSKDSLIE